MKITIDIIIFLTHCCFFVCVQTLCSVNCSKYQNSLERVFSRRKRFIVFPNYASMKITVAMGKSLIAKYPKGVNLSLELSLYYALPTILEEWYPKEYRSSTTENPKMQRKPLKSALDTKDEMMMITTSNLMEYYPFHSEGGTIWLEDGNWDLNSTTFFGKSEKPQQIKHRIWKGDQQYFPPKYSTKYLHRPEHENSKSWMVSSENLQLNKKWQPLMELKSSKWPSYRQKFPERFSYPKANWKYFRGHRERRDLYHQIEEIGTLLGVDMKSCILRSICESKKYLLPKGYSLIQDILRIIFSFPTIDGVLDDFSKAMSSDDNDCGIVYKDKCAFSILDMATNPDKLSK